jgi:hypothetical protein
MRFVYLLTLTFALVQPALAAPAKILLDLGSSSISAKTARQLSSNFNRMGYTVITFQSLNSSAKEELLKFLDGDIHIDDITELRSHIDFIIYGKAFIRTGKAVLASKVNPQSAVIDLKIASLATGQTIYQAKVSATTSYGNPSMAAEKATLIATKKAYDKLNIAINMTNEIKSDYYYELTLNNTKNYALLTAVYNTIESLPQLISSELKVKRIRTAKVHSKLNLENFLAQISSINTPEFTIGLDQIQGYRITLNVIEVEQAKSK